MYLGLLALPEAQKTVATVMVGQVGCWVPSIRQDGLPSNNSHPLTHPTNGGGNYSSSGSHTAAPGAGFSEKYLNLATLQKCFISAGITSGKDELILKNSCLLSACVTFSSRTFKMRDD